MPIIDTVLGILKPIIGSIFPNPEDRLKAQQLQTQVEMALMSSQALIEKAAADNVKAEIASTHWLAANWRPIMMLNFLALIDVRIIAALLGHTFPGVSDSEWLKLWELVTIGMGGYTVGRTAEKIIPAVWGK